MPNELRHLLAQINGADSAFYDEFDQVARKRAATETAKLVEQHPQAFPIEAPPAPAREGILGSMRDLVHGELPQPASPRAELLQNQIRAARAASGIQRNPHSPPPRADMPTALEAGSIGVAQGLDSIGGLAKAIVADPEGARESFGNAGALGELVPYDAPLATKASNVLGQAVPSMVPGLGAGAAAGAAARLVGAGVAAQRTARLAGAAVAPGGQSGVPTYFDSRDAGMDVGASLLNAGVAGATTASITAIFGLTGVEKLLDPVVGRTARAAVAGALRGGGMEASEEMLDQVLNTAREAMTTNPDLTVGQALEQVLMAGFAGGVMGVSMDLASNLLPGPEPTPGDALPDGLGDALRQADPEPAQRPVDPAIAAELAARARREAAEAGVDPKATTAVYPVLQGPTDEDYDAIAERGRRRPLSPADLLLDETQEMGPVRRADPEAATGSFDATEQVSAPSTRPAPPVGPLEGEAIVEAWANENGPELPVELEDDPADADTAPTGIIPRNNPAAESAPTADADTRPTEIPFAKPGQEPSDVVKGWNRPAPISYASGVSRPADLEGIARAGKPVGTSAQHVRGELESGLIAHLQAGGRLFVDSGAFTAFTKGAKHDYADAAKVYAKLAVEGDPPPGHLAVVGPDVVGDQKATLALQRKWRNQIDGLYQYDLDVILPIQKGERDPADVYADMARLIPGFAEKGRVGIPFNEAAWSADDIVAFVERVKPARIHLLGISDANRDYPALLERIAAASPATDVTSDANRIAAKVGAGRPITEAQPQARADARDDIGQESLPDLIARADDAAMGRVAAFFQRPADTPRAELVDMLDGLPLDQVRDILAPGANADLDQAAQREGRTRAVARAFKGEGKPRPRSLPEGPNGPDIANAIAEEGGVRSKPKGYVGGEYDDAPRVVGIATRLFNGASAPDQMAKTLQERGIGDGTVSTMWRTLGKALEARKKAPKRTKAQQRADDEAQREATGPTIPLRPIEPAEDDSYVPFRLRGDGDTPLALSDEDVRRHLPAGTTVVRSKGGGWTITTPGGATIEVRPENDLQAGEGIVAAGAFHIEVDADDVVTGVITLVRGRATKGTWSHELVHAMRHLGLISDSDWTSLLRAHVTPEKLRATRARYQGTRSFAGMNAREQLELLGEEIVAETFEDWSDAGTGPTATVWQRIMDFLRDIAASFGLVNRSADAVARDVQAGKPFTKTPRTATEIPGLKTYARDRDPGLMPEDEDPAVKNQESLLDVLGAKVDKLTAAVEKLATDSPPARTGDFREDILKGKAKRELGQQGLFDDEAEGTTGQERLFSIPREKAPIWRFKAETVVDSPKFPAKADGDAMLAALRNAGVNDRELYWTGLDTIAGKKAVTKDDVRALLANPRVKLVEDLRTDNGAAAVDEARRALHASAGKHLTGAMVEQHAHKLEHLVHERGVDGVLRSLRADIEVTAGRALADAEWTRIAENARALRQAAEDQRKLPPNKRTSYDTYTLAGGTRYRELLITAPGLGAPDTSGWTLRAAGRNVTQRGVAVENVRAYDVVDENDKPVGWDVVGYPSEDGQTVSWRGGDENGVLEGHYKTPEEALKRVKLSAPAIAAKDSAYRSSHWHGVQNPLLHVRFKERVDERGQRVLFIEEIQSDWHQAGRDRGYTKPEDEKRQQELRAEIKQIELKQLDLQDGMRAERRRYKRRTGDIAITDLDSDGALKPEFLRSPEGIAYDALSRQDDELEQQLQKLRQERDSSPRNTVPNGPFAKTWEEIGLRRMVRWAAEHGFERVAWTTGAHQNDRYDQWERVSAIDWMTREQYELNGTKLPEGSDGWLTVHTPHDGTLIDAAHTKSEVEQIIGKEAAAQLFASTPEKINNDRYLIHRIKPADLQLGGEGMISAYDKRLPSIARELGKKFGAKVGKTKVRAGEPKPKTFEPLVVYRQWSFDNDPAEDETMWGVQQGEVTLTENLTREDAIARAQEYLHNAYAGGQLGTGRFILEREDDDDFNLVDATTLQPYIGPVTEAVAHEQMLAYQRSLTGWEIAETEVRAGAPLEEVHVLEITPQLRDHALSGLDLRFSIKRDAPKAGPESLTMKDLEAAPEAEAEERMQTNRGAPSQGWAPRLVEWLKEAKAAFRRRYVHLDAKTDGSLIAIMREMEAGRGSAALLAWRHVTNVVRDLNQAEVVVFERMVILPDIIKDIEAGLYAERPIPFGFEDEAAVRRQLAFYEAKATPAVRKAIAERGEYQRALTRELVDAGKLHPRVLSDSRYFHRQVMAHLSPSEAKFTSWKPKDARDRTRGFQMQRHGGGDFNTSWVESEHAYVTVALSDLATINAQARLKETVDIRESLKAEAKARNFEALVGGAANVTRINELRGKIAQSWAMNREDGKHERAMWGEELSELDPTHRFRITVAQNAAALARQAEEGLFDGSPFEQFLNEALEPGAFDEEGRPSLDMGHPEFWKFLSWIMQQDNEALGADGKLHAGAIFNAIRDREALIASELGTRYLTWKHLVAEHKDYVLWQPEKGNVMFQAYTIGDRAMGDALRALGLDEDADLSENLPDVLTIRTKGMRKALVMGGRKPEWVIPQRVAAQLEQVTPDAAPPDNAIAKALQKAMASWKQWTLIQPLRLARYTTNNISGDIDIMLAGNPAAVKYLPGAGRDVANYLLGKPMDEKAEMRLDQAVRLDLLSSGMTIQDIPDISEVGIFAAMSGKNTSWIRKYFRGVREFQAWRESTFRVAAARAFYDQLAKAPTKRRYGASSKTELDALYAELDAAPKGDQKEIRGRIAAKLARELIGDYGNVSSGGVWLARHLIPFWRWSEINLPRYARLVRNTRHEGRSATGAGAILGTGAVLRAGAGTAARMTVLYGMALAWNAAVKAAMDIPDEEDPNRDRNRFFILTPWRDADGRVIAVPFNGALADALGWFGMHDVAQDVKDFAGAEPGERGEVAGEIIEDSLVAAPNRLLNGVTPYFSVPVAAVFGQQPFPDPLRRPGVIHDQGEYWARLFSVAPIYRIATGKPRGGVSGELIDLLGYRFDAGERDWLEMKAQAAAWKDDIGKGGGKIRGQTLIEFLQGDPSSVKPIHLGRAKQALKRNDHDAFKAHLADYFEAGGSLQGWEQSAEQSHPLGKLAEADKAAFIATLSPRERRQLERAIAWHAKVWKGTPDASADAVVRKAWSEFGLKRRAEKAAAAP